jgi:hypothetical protein
MSRQALEVGAFTWTRVQRLHDAVPAVHWQRCEAEGLQCPLEVFTQLFREDANDPDVAAIVRAVDYSAPSASPFAHRSGPPWPGVRQRVALSWGRVRWELEEFSGTALRQVRVDRVYQHALDEARDRATRFGIVDDRVEVVEHWRDAHSWMVPPVMVAGDVLGTNIGYELLVGVTRFGNLLGLLDRQEIPEVVRQLVWVGRGLKS